MVEYEADGHHFACVFEADGRLAVTADDKQTARGYLIGIWYVFLKVWRWVMIS